MTCFSSSPDAGVRGLFTGYAPTLMEDVPDMAFKFASYETLRKMHGQVFGRTATAKVDRKLFGCIMTHQNIAGICRANA